MTETTVTEKPTRTRAKGTAAVAGALTRAADNLRSAVVHAAGCPEVPEGELTKLRTVHKGVTEMAESYAKQSVSD